MQAEELETDFVLMAPLAISTLQSADGKPDGFQLEIPQLQLQLCGRYAGRKLPQPIATVDFGIIQPVKMGIEKPDFARRAMKLSMIAGPKPTVVPRHIDPPPNAPDFDVEKLAKQFESGWNQTFTTFAMANPLKDIHRNGMALRWEAADWTGKHFAVRLERPAIRVRNTADQAIEYQVHGTGTPWSESLRLAPGDFHEFRPPTALTWRTTSAAGETLFTLPLGFEANVKSITPLRVVQGAVAPVK